MLLLMTLPQCVLLLVLLFSALSDGAHASWDGRERYERIQLHKGKSKEGSVQGERAEQPPSDFSSLPPEHSSTQAPPPSDELEVLARKTYHDLKFHSSNCNMTSMFFHMGINTTKFIGLKAIFKMCEDIGDTAPLSKQECELFNTRLLRASQDMAYIFAGSDFICNLVNGYRDATNALAKTDPFSCTFCERLHSSVEQAIAKFLQLFDAFTMMCARLSAHKQDRCNQFVGAMTSGIRNLVRFYLDPEMAPVFCKIFFQCTST